MYSFNNKNEYKLFLDYLYSLEDLKYKEFHGSLIIDNNLIGIRIPILKKIANQISKNNYQAFIKYNNHDIYELNMLHGLILGDIKLSFKETLTLLDNFIPYINNWAICDITAANLKIFKSNLDEGFIYIQKLITNNNPWSKRLGLVLLNDYYVNTSYIDKIFSIVDNIKTDEYYVNMAIAWLISTCYIKYSDITIKYLKINKLDDWTYNKTLSKITDSTKIDENIKNDIRKLRR